MKSEKIDFKWDLELKRTDKLMVRGPYSSIIL
jgi:hypothetical protein